MRSAVRLCLRGAYEEAFERLDGARSRDPRLLAYRARCLYELGREEEALGTMDEACRARVGQPFLLLAQALLLLDVGRPSEAVTRLRALSATDGGNVLIDPYLGLCLLQASQETAKEGLVLLKSTLMPAPPPLQARVSIALERRLGAGRLTFVPFVLDGLPEIPEAPPIAALNKVLVAPGAAADRLRMFLLDRDRIPLEEAMMEAEKRRAAGDRGGAVAILRAVPRKDDEQILTTLAEHLIALGEPEGLEEALMLLPQREPGKDDYLVTAIRAAALFRKGDPSGALAILEKVQPFVGLEDSDIHYLRGLCAIAASDLRLARRAFERCFALEAPFIAMMLVEAALADI